MNIFCFRRNFARSEASRKRNANQQRAQRVDWVAFSDHKLLDSHVLEPSDLRYLSQARNQARGIVEIVLQYTSGGVSAKPVVEKFIAKQPPVQLSAV
jgi:hypothetical protein